MIEPEIILGPPGTGKTHRCIGIVRKEIANGIPPKRIAFVSFTAKAATEAATRTAEALELDIKALPHFRTMHSTAFRLIGCRTNEVMQNKHYREIGALLGIHFSWKRFDDEGVPSSDYLGDRYNFLDGLSKARMKSPETVWHDVCDDDLDWMQFRQFRDVLADYKRKKKLLDFNDMLMRDCQPLDVDVVIIDEAQDLSALQWNFANRVFKNAKRVYIAGDDDQAIFAWSGADVDYFVDLPGHRTILEQSYRIPSLVHDLAETITNQISHRNEKVYHPREEQGSIEWHRDLDSIDFVEGSWLLLARNIFHLKGLVARVRDAGIPYLYRGEPAIDPRHIEAIKGWEKIRASKSLRPDEIELIREFSKPDADKTLIWHEALTKMPLDDREYYISLLRRGESLTKTPRIHINTIHGVKGGEADHVVLVTDISARTLKSMNVDPDSEHRVFYVGVTRTRKNLHLMHPTTKNYYPIGDY